MEADLLRFYNVDLADLWRGGLTLRRLSVLVQNLPPGSACWSRVNEVPYGWTLTDFLLADIFHAFAGEPHPSRPKPNPEHEAKEKIGLLLAQRERLTKEE